MIPTDIDREINATNRHTGTRPSGDGVGEERFVALRRTYDAPIEDVWDACTDADRLARWFLPVRGDLRVGGRYQLEGNAGGEILRCEPPQLLKVSWVFGDAPTSFVEVRLSPGGAGETVFELEHSGPVDPAFWAQFGPGALGVGWDLTLLGLSSHIHGAQLGDPRAWLASPEAREFMTASSNAWRAAHEKAGAAPAEAADAAARTTAFYAPTEPEPGVV